MNRVASLLIYFIAAIMLNSCNGGSKSLGGVYFVSADGNDNNSGLSADQAWASINRVNEHSFSPGDTLFFRTGDEFTGTLNLNSGDAGTSEQRLVVTSYEKGKARINGLADAAVYADSCHYFTLENLKLFGNGRKSGSTSDGILVTRSMGVSLNELEVSGFQHSGVHMYQCKDARMTYIHAHDNGFAGIHVSGSSIWEVDAYDNENLYIGYCVAENNPGDPTVLEGHSGNGILAASVRGGLIEYCEAFNNGWDMPWTGNGPVGIWIWDATDCIIQHCVAHHNRTNAVAKDGGGFDLDGGVSNSIIQYCVSHNNEGAGYGLYEFGAAKPWENNTIRYCISYDDGILNGGSLGIWKSDDVGSLKNCQIYNNTFYNSLPDRGNLWLYDNYPGIQFRNNVFVYKGSFLSEGTDIGGELFENNLYWNLTGESSFLGYENLEQWAEQRGKEHLEGYFRGLFADPKITGFSMEANDPAKIDPGTFQSLLPQAGSPLIDQGLDLKALMGMDPGDRDLCGTMIPQRQLYDIGALEYR
jgi:hypothetical protein